MLAEIFMLRLEAQSRANQPNGVDHDGERHSLRPYRVAPALIPERFSRQVALVRWI